MDPNHKSNGRGDDRTPSYSIQFEDLRSGNKSQVEVKTTEDVVLGRADVFLHLGIEDLTISKKHIELHPILYDTHNGQVPLMLYARCLSVNQIRILSESDASIASTVLRKDSNAHLLKDGDAIFFSSHISIHIDHKLMPVKVLTDRQQEELKRFCPDFSVSQRSVGAGAQGSMLVTTHIPSGRQMVCKVVDLHKYSALAKDEALYQLEFPRPSEYFHTHDSMDLSSQGEDRNALRFKWRDILARKLAQSRDEVVIQKGVSHANIATIEHTCLTTHTLYIFQELITGGDLFSYLESCGNAGLSDAESALIIRQVLEAVKYLHAHNIVHRDIKPENILMTSWRAGGRVVLTDFGHAKQFVPSSQFQAQPITRQRMMTWVGTTNYLAPEAEPTGGTSDGYSASIDLWSVGAVTAMLLTGELITPNMRVRKGTAVVYDLSILERASTHTTWNRIPQRPKDLIRRLLAVDPNERPSASEALQHSWFTKSAYREYMNSLYHLAIAEWTPTPPAPLEVCDSRDLGLPPIEDESVLEEYVNAWRRRSQ